MSTLKSVSEVARILNLSPQQVRTLCRQGKVPAERVANNWVIDTNSREFNVLSPLSNSSIGEPATKYGNSPIALSFFSGAMGLDLGLEEAGFELRLACEFDKHCQKTIKLNKPDLPVIGDITQYSKEKIFSFAGLSETDDVDLVAGGPPCQAFSTAGNRQGFNDARGNVFLHYIDLALDIRPKFILIENVRGLLSAPMKHRPHSMRDDSFPPLSEDELRGGALNFVIKRLESKGYKCSFNLYNSANYGSPQVRERVIIICSREGETPPFIPPTHSQFESDKLKPWKTFREATSDLQTHNHINFPEKRLKYYRMLKAGENWRSLPDEIQREALGKSYYSGGGKTGFLRRIAWDKPSPTLVTHPAMPATDLGHPEEDRPLSIEEYKRVQEFPDSWHLSGKLLEQYKQVGNAVPRSLAAAAGRLIISLLNGHKITSPIDFRYSRYKNTDHEAWHHEFDRIRQAVKRKESSPKQQELLNV